MKKLFFRYTTGFIPFIALATCAYAQNSESGLALNNPIIESTPAKAKVRDMPVTEGAVNASISSKALKNFNKNFNKTNAVSLFIIQDGYLAEFKEEGIKTKVFYDRKGNNIGNIRSYFEDKLPRQIRHLVKSNYYDYHIYYVQEVNVNNKTAFLVKIEDKDSFKTIRVINGEMDEMEAFDKGK